MLVSISATFSVGVVDTPFPPLHPPPPPPSPPPPLWALANESYASAGSSCFIGIIFLMFSRLELASSSPTS